MRRGAAALLATTVLLAACGDSDDDGGSSTDTTEIGPPGIDESRRSRDNDGDRDRDRSETTAPPTTEAAAIDAPATTAMADSGNADDSRDAAAPVEIESPTFTTTTAAAAEAEVGDFERTSRDARSTFALDVDTASLSLVKNLVASGRLPDPDVVRVEEFVNSFDQDYDAPRSDTFAIYADGAPHELIDDDTVVLRVGLAAEEVSERRRPDANLTFVIDVSGSMSGDGKLDMVKDSLHTLVDNLDDDDRVAIVAYDDRAWLALEPTFIDDADRIHDAIAGLRPGGSTNAAAGLRLGYENARDHFDEGLVNQVIFASDGVANVGETDPDGILSDIAEDAGRGIQMLAIGVGLGEFNDALLERIADAGNGRYAYIDTRDEADRLFSDDLVSTLVTVALDAKIGIEFNADAVSAWRLLGFENRSITDAEFDNEGTDAGEIGAGHTVTALYELDLRRGVDDRDVLADVTLRWIDPDDLSSQEQRGVIRADAIARRLSTASDHLRWDIAVATAAELLRNSEWAEHVSSRDVLDELRDVARDIDTDEADDFVDMFRDAVDLGL